MKQELQQELVNKYPKLYKDYGGNPRETCLAFGFECGDGWYNIIADLSEKLSKYEEIFATQVKEKFGSLRFYIGPCNKENWDEVYKLISEAESKSAETCEVCGKPGKTVGRQWLRTLCVECNKEE